MAHEISNVGFGNEVFTAGELPWHGLGQNVQEAVTSAEAIKLAGLDWEVELRNLTLPDGSMVPDKVASVRKNAAGKDVYLGTVGRKWKPIQNRQGFNFFDSVVGEGQAIYHTAGAIKEGRRVWILAQLPGDMIVKTKRGDDATKKFLLLSNGHDGLLSFRMHLTGVRVVCANTLNAALNSREKGDGIAIRHTGKIEDKVAIAQEALGIATSYYEDMGVILNRFYQEAMNEDKVKAFFKEVYPDNENAEDNFRTVDTRKTMLKLFESGRGSDLSRGTLWGAVNAVTEWVSHERSYGERDGVAERRFDSVLFGQGRQITQKAFDVAKSLVS